jgi:hypothetical protein
MKFKIDQIEINLRIRKPPAQKNFKQEVKKDVRMHKSVVR